MISRILILLSLAAVSSIHCEEKTSGNFSPKFFVFENGARLGSTTEQIKELKQLGFDSLGSAKPHNLTERIKLHNDSGLKISSIYIGGKIGTEINPTIPESIRNLKGQETIIELFVQRGGKNTDAQAVDFVRNIADLAKDSGLMVVLYPHAGFYIDTVGDAVRIAKAVDRDNVGVMFNLCHFLKVEPESDLRTTLESTGDLLWRVSICGADIDGKDWGTLIQTLDEGTFDQLSLLRILKESGYSGEVGLQCYAIRGDAKENLARSIKAWRRYLATLEE